MICTPQQRAALHETEDSTLQPSATRTVGHSHRIGEGARPQPRRNAWGPGATPRPRLMSARWGGGGAASLDGARLPSLGRLPLLGLTAI
eukprot:6974249-Prymnesium_polylepis.1